MSTDVIQSRDDLRAETTKLLNAISKKDLLEQFGISRVSELTGLDAIGLPVYSCVRPLTATIAIHAGKGLTREGSRAGAIAEAIEFQIAENPTGPFRALPAFQVPCDERLELADCFPARSSIVNELTPVAWETAINIFNGEEKLVPSDLVWLKNRIDNQPLMYFQTGTNGIAAGGTLEDAILSGLYEVIERDAWTLYQYVLDNCGILPVRTPLAGTGSRIEECVSRIERAGLKVHLFDITTDYQVPVFNATILDTSGNCAGTFGGYGAHINAEMAAIRAITEAAQGRCCYISGARDDLFRRHYLLMKRMDQHQLDKMFSELQAGLPLSNYRKMDFPDVRTELRYLLKMIRPHGISEVFVKELGTVLEGRIKVVRVISPQCEPFRFDHWAPGLRCLSYANRRMKEATQQQPIDKESEEGEAWKDAE